MEPVAQHAGGCPVGGAVTGVQAVVRKDACSEGRGWPRMVADGLIVLVSFSTSTQPIDVKLVMAGPYRCLR